MTVDKNNKTMGIGVIVRDNNGEVLATFSAPKAHIIDPVIAKASAALRAITLLRELCFYKVIMEGNALQII